MHAYARMLIKLAPHAVWHSFAALVEHLGSPQVVPPLPHRASLPLSQGDHGHLPRPSSETAATVPPLPTLTMQIAIMMMTHTRKRLRNAIPVTICPARVVQTSRHLIVLLSNNLTKVLRKFTNASFEHVLHVTDPARKVSWVIGSSRASLTIRLGNS